MRNTLWLLVGLLVALAAPAWGEDEEADRATALKTHLAALKKGELKQLEFLLVAKPLVADPLPLLPAVRIERISEIVALFTHLEEAAMRRVLVLGPPSPAVARVVVTPLEGDEFAMDVTTRAFRILDGEMAAFIFQSPALLRWIEDRLEMPHYDLREEEPPALAALLETFRVNTTGLTREASPGTPGEEGHHASGPMVLNGDFETELVLEGQRKPSPLGWDRVDNLTTFWKDDPFPREDGAKGGKALVMDTDVLEAEWLKRKKEMTANPDSPSWTKSLVEPERQYSTVGATYGVSCYSAPIPIEKGQAYRITLDFRTGAANGGISKIWVRGYGKVEVRGTPEWRRIYDSLHTLRTNDPTWHTYTNVFHPTKNTPRVGQIRVMLYSYWPRGEYRWDNVRIVPITDEDYRDAKATERSDIR